MRKRDFTEFRFKNSQNEASVGSLRFLNNSVFSLLPSKLMTPVYVKKIYP